MADALLLENGNYLLLENGSHLLLDGPGAGAPSARTVSAVLSFYDILNAAGDSLSQPSLIEKTASIAKPPSAPSSILSFYDLLNAVGESLHQSLLIEGPRVSNATEITSYLLLNDCVLHYVLQ